MIRTKDFAVHQQLNEEECPASNLCRSWRDFGWEPGVQVANLVPVEVIS